MSTAVRKSVLDEVVHLVDPTGAIFIKEDELRNRLETLNLLQQWDVAVRVTRKAYAWGPASSVDEYLEFCAARNKLFLRIVEHNLDLEPIIAANEL